MQSTPPPNWQPLSALPVLSDMLHDQRDGMVEQLELLQEAKRRPGVLDDLAVARIIRVHVEQMEAMSLFRQQASRWLKDASTPELAAVEKFCDLIARVHEKLGEIVTIARQLNR